MRRLRNQQGALVLAMTLVLLLAAVGATAALGARIETLIAANFRQGQEALYVAEGGLARAIQELAPLTDWTVVLAGAPSTFAEGTPTGSKQLPGGDTVVLCCGDGSLTSDLQQRGNAGGNWGANTPEWRLFGWGAASSWLTAARSPSPFYVVIWVADDVDEGDGNPSLDSNGAVVVHALALGPGRARRSIQATIRHARREDGTPLGRGVSIVSIRESRW